MNELRNENHNANSASETSRMIAAAYSRDLEKPELNAFKELSRKSRKYGFPIVNILQDKSRQEQIHWAACLLLEVADSWPLSDVPGLLEFVPDTALLRDARELLANGDANFQHIVK